MGKTVLLWQWHGYSLDALTLKLLANGLLLMEISVKMELQFLWDDRNPYWLTFASPRSSMVLKNPRYGRTASHATIV